MLAIPSKSYIQPLMIIAAMPFGVLGAILGHLLLGMNLTIQSIMGMLALAGVVINDSLVLVDFVNNKRRRGIGIETAIMESGKARIRAILLTSLTTFIGLLPLIFAENTQAQFLIPMAVSLGFGILFATFITLILIPINYVIIDDIQGLFSERPQWETE